ncbi:granulocyte-macrophage colony-stimulating factor receptor subunit alpha-like isoform X2 [Mixophyes fleayi]|uniref:granulocyte-macrophage colony-stimulating factor receptor subunit alpha-like isoform X2 n=1 Tax=Mixophyes fleayi TaxID=3061075 RepID=UPI003F4E0074
MVHSSYLVFLIILWFSLQLVCKVTMVSPDASFAPLPTNLKVAMYPGLLNVTWDCNITKSMENYTYNLLLQRKLEEPLNMSTCFFQHEVSLHMQFVLHNGVFINISTEKLSNKEKVKNNWTEIILIPEGKINTAADIFSCMIYNVSLMNCSWSVGKEAPEDTQYSLDLWQNSPFLNGKVVNIKCQVYIKDSFGRQVGCVFKSPNIEFQRPVYIVIVGSSNQTSIQFFDEKITPNDHVILDPPRNINLSYYSSELEIKWEKPITQSYVSDVCFEYNIYFKEKGGINVTTPGTSFKTNQFLSNEEVTVMMRVKWIDLCSQNYKTWSKWSDPHKLGSKSTGFIPKHLLIVLGIGTAVVLILLIILCRRFRIWTKLFPRVPKPALKMFDTVEQKEIEEENVRLLWTELAREAREA